MEERLAVLEDGGNAADAAVATALALAVVLPHTPVSSTTIVGPDGVAAIQAAATVSASPADATPISAIAGLATKLAPIGRA